MCQQYVSRQVIRSFQMDNRSEKIIMGIDPGTNVMGYGVISTMGNKVKMVAMGVIDMQKMSDPYLRLGHISERVDGLIASYLPDEIAIEAPFFGKNVQSMLKLGRAQGVAIAAAIRRDVPVHEYAPLKIKMALTGNGAASKEQVAGMLQRILKLRNDEMPAYMDATDALAAAYCHFMQMSTPNTGGQHFKSWKDFATKNKNRIQQHRTANNASGSAVTKDSKQK
jgi:crossover junction endodeoxyribonuclease RuvC